MSTASKSSKSSLVNSLAKRYDPKALQNQRPTAAQKASQNNLVCKDSKTAVNRTTMDIKFDSLCQKIDNLLTEQNTVVKKLEDISQNIIGIEEDLNLIKSEDTPAKENSEDKENILEMKGLFSEMINQLSSINKYAEQQAKRLDGVEQILLGTQNVVWSIMKEIRFPAVLDFLQKTPNHLNSQNIDNKMKKTEKGCQKAKDSTKYKKGVKVQNVKKKRNNLHHKKKHEVTTGQKSNQNKALSLDFEGTKHVTEPQPDSERCVQRLCTQNEKVEKLNEENAKKTTAILVDNHFPNFDTEEVCDVNHCISIDISILDSQTFIEEWSQIGDVEVADNEQSSLPNKELIQLTAIDNKEAEDSEDHLSENQEHVEETIQTISICTDEENILSETEDVGDESENKEKCQEEDNNQDEFTQENKNTLLVTEDENSVPSEDGDQNDTDTSQNIEHYSDLEDGQLGTTGAVSSPCAGKILEVPKDDNTLSEELPKNGETDNYDYSCSSKRRVTDEEDKDDTKKSRVDANIMEDIIRNKEETIYKVENSNEELQETDFTENCTEQSAVEEKEEILILDTKPPPPAPFDHRIVSAKHAQINSFYSLESKEVLGSGRFGQVHKCVEKSSGLKLAAKVIKVRGHKEKEEVKNEITVMNQLSHANLIQLYDAFESRNDIVLVMEYVDGGELFDRIIDENSNLSEVDTILFIKQICEGIQYMHQMYIIHLDLKPENIMCVSRAANQIKIIDFGLARRYKPREKLKVNFGTPEFLAPEVVNYDFVSFPTDMWSVGVIAYMLLSGLSPFLGEDDNETLNNIIACQWDFEGEEFETISDDAKDFIIKLLVKEKCWRMSATESLKHSWLSDSKLHYRIRQQTKKKPSLIEAPVGQ
ncbi:myosin light chain kinase family member 4 [Bombina bombina]|uniref:myosin light chain kinase family member 4 n=1 Tax=Bombina bombina TaxID=8345 RepID=UPI00235ACDB5|nr:myosin light chain kinase family member 4 [Bombina bombina]